MQFQLFRVSINPGFSALFAQSMSKEARFELLTRAIQSNSTGEYRNREYNLYNVEVRGDVVWGRVSHPDTVERALPSNSDPTKLVDVSEVSNSWAHFMLMGVGVHVLAVQRKSDFFSGTADGLARIFENLIQAGLSSSDFEVAVEPLSLVSDFWGAIDKCTRLTRVELTFTAPNMFGGSEKLSPILEIARSYHNANRFRSAVESPSGNLRFPKDEHTESELSYLSKGGGSWEVEGDDDKGTRQVFKSRESTPIFVSLNDEDEELKRSISHQVEQLRALINERLERHKGQ